MKTSNRWNVRYIAGRLVLGFVMTLMIGSINVAPAFSKDHNKHMQNHGPYEQRGRGNVRSEHRRNDRDQRDDRERRYDYGGPPGFFTPPPPPGIGIFFPPVLIQL